MSLQEGFTKVFQENFETSVCQKQIRIYIYFVYLYAYIAGYKWANNLSGKVRFVLPLEIVQFIRTRTLDSCHKYRRRPSCPQMVGVQQQQQEFVSGRAETRDKLVLRSCIQEMRSLAPRPGGREVRGSKCGAVLRWSQDASTPNWVGGISLSCFVSHRRHLLSCRNEEEKMVCVHVRHVKQKTIVLLHLKRIVAIV